MRGDGVDCELYDYAHTFSGEGVGYGNMSTMRE